MFVKMYIPPRKSKKDDRKCKFSQDLTPPIGGGIRKSDAGEA
jgi:hypothetical protein